MTGRARLLSGITLGVFLAACPRLGAPWLVWNASGSAPLGLYAVDHPSALHLGDLVIVRPPESIAQFLAAGGYLPIGAPLLKYVAALSGQQVCRIGLVITIDGTAIGDSRERDTRGRPLPVWSGCRVLADNEVFLLNPLVPDSLDGRYLGALPITSIIGRAIPLWTDEPVWED
jgi:conjugative transfer signal peptidase TraF